MFRLFSYFQNGNNTFNKGMLWNIGFTEALKLEQFDCIFLHDVDHLPEDDRYQSMIIIHDIDQDLIQEPVSLSPSALACSRRC